MNLNSREIRRFNIYLLLTEYFSLGRKKRGSLTYSTDQENEVSKIFIIFLFCVWQVRERFRFIRNGFEFRKQVESKTNQFEIVFKSLVRFSTQFRVKESFKLLYLLLKLRKFGDKSRNSLNLATTKL